MSWFSNIFGDDEKSEEKPKKKKAEKSKERKPAASDLDIPELDLDKYVAEKPELDEIKSGSDYVDYINKIHESEKQKDG